MSASRAQYAFVLSLLLGYRIVAWLVRRIGKERQLRLLRRTAEVAQRDSR